MKAICNNKQLIINADDFGITSGVNRAIMEAYACGAVTSASIMVNMWAFEEAVELAKSVPSLGVGLHFTLAAGKPVSPPEKVSTLVDNKGFFLTRSKLMFKLLRKKVSSDELKRELHAQNEKLEKYGIKADHIDGDQHVHILPGVSQHIADLANELGKIPVRIPNEQLCVNINRMNDKDALKALSVLYLRKYWAKRLKRLLEKNKISSNDGFISIFGIVPRHAPTIQDLAQLISVVKPGVCEFMVHPGHYDINYKAFFGSEALAKERETEFCLLTSDSFQNILRQHSINPINYGDIHVSKDVV